MCSGRWILALALLISLCHPSFAQTSDWAALSPLLSGQKVKVETADGQSHVGKVQSVTENSILIGKNQVIQKEDVQDVRLWSPGHHGRNALIGLGIGAGFGIAVGTGCSGQYSFVSRGECMAVGAPLFGGAGAAVGALLPSRGQWREIYRSNSRSASEPRQSATQADPPELK